MVNVNTQIEKIIKEQYKINIKTMANNSELIALCEERAKQWLSPSFDEETRKDVQAMLDNERSEEHTSELQSRI